MYSRGTGYDNSIDDNNNKNKNNSNNNNNNDNNNLAKVIPQEGYPVSRSDWRLDYSFLWMEENQRT